MEEENRNYDPVQLQETMVVNIEEEPSDHKKQPEKREPKKNTKKKRRLSRTGRNILRTILVISLGVAGYSGFQLYKGLKDYRDSENAYHNLAAETEGEVVETTNDEQGDTLVYTKANFTALAEINPDVAGWLSLEGTVISYPVVKGTDNEYYLHHLFTGEYNNTGCIFIDMDNTRDFSDRNTIMYAHHMRNGSMFAELEGYRNQEYYEQHKQLILQTPDGVYTLEPFAGLLADGYSDYVQIEFADDESFMAYVNGMREQSTFQSDVSVTAADRIVTMSTCRYDTENGRYAVFAKLSKVG